MRLIVFYITGNKNVFVSFLDYYKAYMLSVETVVFTPMLEYLFSSVLHGLSCLRRAKQKKLIRGGKLDKIGSWFSRLMNIYRSTVQYILEALWQGGVICARSKV